MKEFNIFVVIVGLWVMGSWGTNLYKFVTSDFEAPYKEEIIHGIAVPAAPISLVTCWFDFSEDE